MVYISDCRTSLIQSSIKYQSCMSTMIVACVPRDFEIGRLDTWEIAFRGRYISREGNFNGIIDLVIISHFHLVSLYCLIDVDNNFAIFA